MYVLFIRTVLCCIIVPNEFRGAWFLHYFEIDFTNTIRNNTGRANKNKKTAYEVPKKKKKAAFRRDRNEIGRGNRTDHALRKKKSVGSGAVNFFLLTRQIEFRTNRIIWGSLLKFPLKFTNTHRNIRTGCLSNSIKCTIKKLKIISFRSAKIILQIAVVHTTTEMIFQGWRLYGLKYRIP